MAVEGTTWVEVCGTRRHSFPVRSAVSLALVAGAAIGAGGSGSAQVQLVADEVTNWNFLHGTQDALDESLALDIDLDGVQDLVCRADGNRLVWSSAPAIRQHRRVLALPAGLATGDASASLLLRSAERGVG